MPADLPPPPPPLKQRPHYGRDPLPLLVVVLALALVFGAYLVGRLQARPAKTEPPCVVIDLRTKPGPGKLIPAEPGI